MNTRMIIVVGLISVAAAWSLPLSASPYDEGLGGSDIQPAVNEAKTMAKADTGGYYAILSIYMAGTLFAVNVSTTAGCGNPSGWWGVDTATASGSNFRANALAAFHSGKKVKMYCGSIYNTWNSPSDMYVQ